MIINVSFGNQLHAIRLGEEDDEGNEDEHTLLDLSEAVLESLLNSQRKQPKLASLTVILRAGGR